MTNETLVLPKSSSEKQHAPLFPIVTPLIFLPSGRMRDLTRETSLVDVPNSDDVRTTRRLTRPTRRSIATVAKCKLLRAASAWSSAFAAARCFHPTKPPLEAPFDCSFLRAPKSALIAFSHATTSCPVRALHALKFREWSHFYSMHVRGSASQTVRRIRTKCQRY